MNTITKATRIRGRLDSDLLENALQDLRAQQPALRTQFAMVDGEVVREVRDPAPDRVLEVLDAAPTPEALATLADAVRASLSPEASPWRALLLRHEVDDHTLVFAAHRIVWDERSMAELCAHLSRPFQTGERVPASTKDATSTASEAEIAEGACFFAATLAGVPPVHGFPLAAPRGKGAHAAATVDTALAPRVTERLLHAARAWDVEPFLLEIAAAAYVLAQFCGHTKVAMGIPFDLRQQPAAHLGSHTTTLPLGFDTAASTFRDLVRSMGQSISEAQAHATTPFHAVAKIAGAGTGLSANPLFQVACAPSAELMLTLEGCACVPREIDAPPQQVDLFLEMTSNRLRAAFDSHWIDREVAAAFGRCWATLLEAALEDPERALSDLPLLDREEQAALAARAEQVAEPALLERDLFERVVGGFGDNPSKAALVCRGRAVSYAELAQRIEALARELAAAPGSLVGICLPRSPEMVAVLLAVLRSGAAYVPLDPTFPATRLKYVVEHSGLTRVVTTSSLRSHFDPELVQVIELGSGAGVPVPVAPPSAVAGDLPAYVIYTSGSTGRPKGVAVPRRAVSNLLGSVCLRLGIGSDDTLCAVTTLSFDISVLELFAPLAAGGTVVIATEEEAREPRLLADLLQTTGATMLQATPATWQMLCQAGWAGNPRLVAMSGGEALTSSLAASLLPRVGALWNMYGPTETTVWSTCHQVRDARDPISVGSPIHNTTVHIVDEHLRPVAPGVEGRLFIGGEGLALGYVHDKELTARRFVPDPFRGQGRIYETGDLARRDASGLLYVTGRSDDQIKLRGFRIEPGEVEARLVSLGPIAQSICVVRRDRPESPELVAYYTTKPGAADPTLAELREHCAATLPAYMVPSRFVRLEFFPRTPNGKIDRHAFPAPMAGPEPPSDPRTPRSDVERVLAEAWASVLAVPEVALHQAFFDMGGTSLDAVAVAELAGKRLGVDVPVLSIFEHPTVAALAKHLERRRNDLAFVRDARERAAGRRRLTPSASAFDVAIVGMAGRFPGARDLDELWNNLREGRETVTFFKREELDPAIPVSDREDPAYVPARGVLEGADLFDAAFFGINPNEAELMDPQLRVFMEVAWEAFESAGIVGEDVRGPVGVWAGMGNNFYYPFNVLTRPDKLAIMGEIAAEIGNEKDHIAPRISHKLNLTGPSLSVHTACSTTLVVVENAYQALVTHQVDVALAGGVDVRTPQKSGQRYEEGGIFSIDGHCRPFDAAATGTMFGDGVGAVVLKRLDDALRDGDTVHAVLKGAAVNHDGGQKVSYLAPSVDGQARVIAAALAIADVHPDTITLVEAHGTATPIGDPIEVEALSRVFRAFTPRRGYCALGSIKGNFGHATTAAGIAGLLKVVLALRHGMIPPTLHYSSPNPRIDFESSPFFVADKLRPWRPSGTPRRAAISSFGFCGTNAHAILEEAPKAPATSAPARPLQLLLTSARSAEGLASTAKALGDALGGASVDELSDAAYTLHVGRKRHELRRCAVIGPDDDALAALTTEAGFRIASLRSEIDDPDVAFVFPGQGVQHVGMGLALYRTEPRFREALDTCAEMLKPHLECDLRTLLLAAPSDRDRASASLNETRYTQAAVFSVSYSTAVLFMHWGLKPAAVAGHSIGEFVAATLSGVMRLEDALPLVAMRGRLMQGLARGSMLAVRVSVSRLRGRLPPNVDLAAINAPEACVLAGPTEAIERLAVELEAEGVPCRRLRTSHAFHSSMMAPAVGPFLRAVQAIRLSPPRVPFISTVTGDFADRELTAPEYWARHLHSPVLCSSALQRLLADPNRVVFDCGPGRVPSALALQHGPANPRRVVAAMPEPSACDEEHGTALFGLGCLWLNGCHIDWNAFHEGESRRRIRIPTYRFQRQRHWIEPGALPRSDTEQTCAAQIEPPPPAAPASTAAPATIDSIEQGVRALVGELTGRAISDVDDDTSFLELGLDSLLLTQLARGVRARTGVDVTFRQLAQECGTVRRLCQKVRSRNRTDGGSAEPRPSAAGDSPRTPAQRLDLAATPAQLEMWVAAQSSPQASCAYNLVLAATLTGPIDEESLERALRILPERHQALRGHFSADGSRFVVEPTLDLVIARHDLTHLPREERLEHLRRVADEDAKRPYDVEHGPLCRASVVIVDETMRTVLLSVHHTACDGWSLDVLLADLARLYSELAGRGAPAPPPRHSFSDFVAHRASADGSARIEASRAYWGKALAELPPPLELPHDGRRPPVRTYDAHAVSHDISTASVAAIRSFAAAHQLSFFSVLLSGLAALLYRISGVSDFVVGVPVAQHPDVDMDDCVGPLVNLVPVRCLPVGGSPFLDLCSATHAAVLAARENAATTFGQIVTDLGVPRDPARVPLVQILFTHVLRQPATKHAFVGCSSDYRLCPRSFEAFELNLAVVDSGAGLELTVHGNSDLFSKAWLDLRLRELEHLLVSACRSPSKALDELALLPPDEADALRNFNETTRPFPRNATVHGLFDEQARKTPDACAIRGARESLAYGDLETRANRLARMLRRRGAGRGKLVGLCLSRSAEMVVALLAVLKSGAAYVPLDPALPPARLAFMTGDSKLELVVSESDLRSRHAFPPERTIEVDRDAAEVAEESCAPLSGDAESARAEDLAYVLYTSGSTGKPKGVCIPHRAAVNFLVSMQREPGITRDDSLLAVTTLSFDISLLELLLPLTIGARVILASHDDARDGEALQQWIRSEHVTILQATPATWRLLVDSGWAGTPDLKALCGGEALAPDLAAALLERVNQLWNMYGPTETTVWSTCERVSDARLPIAVGRPIANTQVWVLDPHGNLSPLGVAGEICIGGEGVALAYHERPELTAERFVAIPPSLSLAAGSGEGKLYKTGDVGRRRITDGRLECLGRRDFQVKLRGYRIELGEIETCLAENPAIREACVVAIESRPGDRTLAAYFATRDGQTLTGTDLRSSLLRALPDYMVPQHLVEVEALPRTPNGKVDRPALPRSFDGAEADREAVPPRTAAEQLLAEIWQELLGRTVSADENFFEAGGDSLRVVRAIARIQERTGVRLSPRHFVVDTLAQMAKQVEGGAARSADGAERTVGRPAPARGVLGRLKTRLLG